MSTYKDALSFLLHFVLFTFILFLLPSVNSIYFNIRSFIPGDPRIDYQGDARPLSGSVEFNLINYLNRVGRVTCRNPIHLWDSSTGELSDFSTNFSFAIDTRGTINYGHGLAFFLAPVDFPIPVNSGGGFLGLFNTTTADIDSKNQIILVEFDTFPNLEWDPVTEHVGINVNSIVSAVFAAWNASLRSGEAVETWIKYNATTSNLTISWITPLAGNSQNISTLSFYIDMKKVLPEWVTVGFSASTGQAIERHVLHSWEFSSNLEDKISDNRKNNSRKIKIVLSLLLPFVSLLGLIVMACFLLNRKGLKAAETTNQISMNFQTGIGPKKFQYRELASATNNFSVKKKLGQGGFGGVYKGFISRLAMDVAVKKISRESRQGKKEYITEVKIISQLRHRNLVQLLGWCHEKREFLLVYDYMPQGSLDFHLFGTKSRLTWVVRYNIALGLASALLYLHEDGSRCVVHRDIKSSNVMLDADFTAKLGDFGLAKLMDHNVCLKTTGLAGTIGYMAPEYISTGKASKKSDVYSFGVVALEIACGRKSVDVFEEESPVGLVEWVWTLYGRGQILQVVDGSMCQEFDAKQMERLIICGLWCAHPDHSLRPSIRKVIDVLKFVAAAPSLPHNMPVITYGQHVPLISSSGPSMTYTSLAMGR